MRVPSAPAAVPSIVNSTPSASNIAPNGVVALATTGEVSDTAMRYGAESNTQFTTRRKAPHRAVQRRLDASFCQ